MMPSSCNATDLGVVLLQLQCKICTFIRHKDRQY